MPSETMLLWFETTVVYGWQDIYYVYKVLCSYRNNGLIKENSCLTLSYGIPQQVSIKSIKISLSAWCYTNKQIHLISMQTFFHL